MELDQQARVRFELLGSDLGGSGWPRALAQTVPREFSCR